MTEYHDKTIEAVDRARVALEMKNAEGKDIDARTYVDKTKTEGTLKGLRCLIYNATGGPLKLVAIFEYNGRLSDSPLPTVLQNGQWAAFFHASSLDCCHAALVYESIQNPGRQWALGWYPNTSVINRCYAEIRPKGYYSMSDLATQKSVDLRKNILESTPLIHTAEDAGDVIFSSIGETNPPIYEAIMTRTAALG